MKTKKGYRSLHPIQAGSSDIGRARWGLLLDFLLVLSFVWFGWAAPVHAGWTGVGPDGGRITAFAVDPGNTLILYAGTARGLFKSTTGGMDWRNSGLSKSSISSLAIDPQNPQILYAGTDRDLYKSTDGGTNWSVLEVTDLSVPISFLLIDPNDTHTLYAGTQNGYSASVFKSINGGATWSRLDLAGYSIACLVLDPQDSKTLYAGSGGGYGMFKSTDGGATWNSSGLRGYSISSLAIDPLDDQTLYAGIQSGGGVLKSVDGGTTWNSVGGATFTFLSLTLDPRYPQTLYGTTIHGVRKSTNGGATWRRLPLGDLSTVFALDPRNSQTLYAGIYPDGLFKSTDGGARWTAINSGLRDTLLLVPALAIDPHDPRILYAGTFRGLFKSDNGGLKWRNVNTGLPTSARSISALTIDPFDSLILYAGLTDSYGSGYGAYKTTDGGSRWDGAHLGGYLHAFAIDPHAPRTLYAGTDYGLYKTIDGGKSWAAAGLGSKGIYALAVSAANPQKVYVGSYPGVFRSDNGGARWQSVSSGLPGRGVTALALDPHNPQILYAGTPDGLFKSTNGGTGWSASGLKRKRINTLVFDSGNPPALYAGTTAGVFKSTTGGTNWSPANSGLTSTYIASLAVDPGNPKVLYAGTMGGVFKSVDGASDETLKLSLTFLPDLNGNDSKEFALLQQKKNLDYETTLRIEDSETGQSVKEIPCLDPQSRPISLIRIDNVDNSGNPGLAILAVTETSTGKIRQVKVELRSPLTGTFIRTIPFPYDAGYTPKALFWLDDLDGNGFCELALLGTNLSTGQSTVRIEDSFSGARLTGFAVGADNTTSSIALWTVPDLNGNGSQELAILQRDTKTGLSQIKVVDVRTHWVLKTLPCLNSSLIPLGMAWIRDMNGNGFPEQAILATAQNGGRVVVEIRDMLTGEALKTIVFDSRFAPLGFATADLLGNKAFEVGVLGRNRTTGATRLEIRDSVTGSLIQTVPVP